MFTRKVAMAEMSFGAIKLFVDLDPRPSRCVDPVNARVLHRIERTVRSEDVSRIAKFRLAELFPDTGRWVCGVELSLIHI